MNAANREAVAQQLVGNLGDQLRNAGWPHEEVVCVLLHALQLAEQLSAATHAKSARPDAMARIEACKAELQRRAG